MNILEAFKDWLEDEGFGTFGTNLFINGVDYDAPNECYWITSGGGTPIVKNVTGEKQKNYIINLYYRHTNSETVSNKLQEIEELINSSSNIELDDYVILDQEVSMFPIDKDIDNEERVIGLLQISLTVYQ